MGRTVVVSVEAVPSVSDPTAAPSCSDGGVGSRASLPPALHDGATESAKEESEESFGDASVSPPPPPAATVWSLSMV